MIKKFAFLFLSVFLVCTSIIEAQNRLVLTKESQINLLKKINAIEIIGTAVSQTDIYSPYRNTRINIYADSVYLFSDSTNYRANYSLLFSLKNITADSIYIKVCSNEFEEFTTAAVPFENNCFDLRKPITIRERATGCIGFWREPLDHRYIDDNHFSSGRVFKREDLQYIPKKSRLKYID